MQELLREARIDFTVEKFLVRGLDYYTRTVYEIAHSALGARDAVGGGGRYDNLVEDLGGPPTGAVGFSLGSTPVILALRKQRAPLSDTERGRRGVYIVVDERASTEAFRLMERLRAEGVPAEMLFDGKSVKAQMRAANRADGPGGRSSSGRTKSPPARPRSRI